MRPTPALVFLSLCLGSCAGLSAEQRDTRAAIQLGMRGLDEDLWAPIEDQFMLGAECVVMSKETGLGFETSLAYSNDEDDIGGIDVSATTNEISVGMRAELTEQNVRPYIGAGLAYINAEIEASNGSASASEDDGSIAGYAHAGIEIPFAERFYIGLDLRALFGSDLDYGGVAADADYTQFALVIGASF